jgi:hypothetical protein
MVFVIESVSMDEKVGQPGVCFSDGEELLFFCTCDGEEEEELLLLELELEEELLLELEEELLLELEEDDDEEEDFSSCPSFCFLLGLGAPVETEASRSRKTRGSTLPSLPSWSFLTSMTSSSPSSTTSAARFFDFLPRCFLPETSSLPSLT